MKERSICDFVAELSSAAPVPGGGGASALAGALGAALGSMAANLTIGKKKYLEVEPLMIQSANNLKRIAEQMEDLIAEDAEAFEPLSRAYGLPKATEEEKQYKEEVLQKALYEAAQPPLKMITLALEALVILEMLSEKASRLVVSDVGCGAAMARAAIEGAALNVYINAKMIHDEKTAKDLFDNTKSMVEKGTALAGKIYQEVEAALCKANS